MHRIVDIILDSAIRFEEETGRKPRNVYLGETEIRALKSYVQDIGYINASYIGMARNRRPMVHGLNVYAVDSVTHIACT